MNHPVDITVFNDPGRRGAFVNFPSEIVNGNSPSITTICTPASGSFFPPGTTTVMCTATDEAGNASTDTFKVRVILDPCRFFSPRTEVILAVPLNIECLADITGTVFICNGQTPLPDATVTLSSSSPAVSFSPNPVTTDAAGNFTATLNVEPGTPSTSATITAITNGASISQTLTIECCEQFITLTVPPNIVCSDDIFGRVTCDEIAPAPGATVTLSSSSPAVSFSPNPVTTDAAGNFTATLNVEPGTPSTSATITAITNGASISQTLTIECCEQFITLTVPPNIVCSDDIFGRITCDEIAPAPGATVTLSSSSPSVSFSPNPTVTDGAGNFTSTVNVAAGTTPTPITITASTDGATASQISTIECCSFLVYVTNAGAPAPGENDTVSVIDTGTNTVIATIPVGDAPLEAAVTPNGTRVYVPNFFSDNVTVIDTATNTVITTIVVGDGPLGIAISPDGSTAYVSNHGFVPGPDTVSVIDIATNMVTATIPVGDGPQGIAFTPDGTTAYVANELSDTVSVIDTATNTVIDTINVGDRPRSIAILPDGTRAYLTNQESDNVSVIDTTTNTVIDTILVGDSPVGTALSPDGTRLYIVNKNSNNVSLIDTATNTVIDTIPVGLSPDQVTILPDGTRAYVTNQADNTVSVIDTATNTVIATVPVGVAPTGIETGTICR